MDFKITMNKKGEIVEGIVVKVEPNTIYLDVQDVTEGKIHLDNYSKPALDTFIGHVKVGDKVRAKVQKRIDSDEAQVLLLSRLPLLTDEYFKEIQTLVETGETVSAKVVKIIEQKGLILNYKDNEVFLPFSLLDFEYAKEPEKVKGQTLEVQLIEATQKGRNKRIVGSRKMIFERERQKAYEQRVELRQKELETINTGDVVTGTVEKIEKHAATIKFEHVVGLLRISQVSHHRIDQINELLKEGETVQVKVIKKEGNRLDLSMKALLETPFELFAKAHKIGEKITGKVFQKLPFGVIVEVEKDVRGLLHKNEISWNPNDNYDSYLKIGDDIELLIVNIDAKKERIALSKRSLEDNPWKNVHAKRGDKVKTVVKAFVTDGILVEVQGVEVTIPNNELFLEKGKAEDFYAVGDEVEALVIDVNKQDWILKLSVKKIHERLERESFEKYLENDEEQGNMTIGDLFEDDLKK